MASDPGVLVFAAHAGTDPAGPALGVLSDAVDRRVTVEADGPGSGGFRIDGHSAQAAWAAPGNYVAVHRDAHAGEPIAGFWIGEGADTLVSPHEEGGHAWTRSGSGPIACLDEALVWSRAFRRGRGTVERRRGRWRWRRRAGFQLATPLLRLLREAKARGAIPFVTWDFSSSRDSDGTRWPDDTELRRYSVPIGITLAELVTMLRAKGLRIAMDGAFVLHAWPEDREHDLSGSVGLAAGVDIREDVARERIARRSRSHALVGGERHRGGDRYAVVRDAAIRAELGRRTEGFRDVGRTARKAVLRRAGRRSLRRWDRLRRGAASVPVIDTGGQVALRDYRPGDTVTLTIAGAYEGAHRIEAITLVETAAGEYDPVLEFGGLIGDARVGEDWSDDAATAERH